MFIVPGVCRFNINGLFSGRNAVNIIDMTIDTTGSVISRADACAQQAGIILQEWEDSILPVVVDDYSGRSVSWVDLDSASGSIGVTTTGSGTAAWPSSGELTTDPSPGNLSALVTKVINGERGRRSGRTYVVGLPEVATSSTNPNTLTSAYIADLQAGMTSFLGDIQQDDSLFDFGSTMDVVHITEVDPDPPHSPTAGDSRPVSALVVQSTLATQRRRMRG